MQFVSTSEPTMQLRIIIMQSDYTVGRLAEKSNKLGKLIGIVAESTLKKNKGLSSFTLKR